MPITQFEGKALVFNNGVVDVKQGDVSLVDENKVAHIPVSNAEIDNKTIITNANNKLEVPFDNNTIYVDQDGFVKARGGSGSSYTAGNGIEIYDDEEVRVKSDNTTLEATSDSLHIKDGVLPKYSVEPATSSFVYDHTWSPNITWETGSGSNLGDKYASEWVTRSSFTGFAQFKVTISDTGSGDTYTGTLNITEDNDYVSAYGSLSKETSGTGPSSWYSEPSGPIIKISKDDGFFQLFLSEVEASKINGEVTITINGIGIAKQYVDLGSQLGTGWETDHEYTVKFKNGKLYLTY